MLLFADKFTLKSDDPGHIQQTYWVKVEFFWVGFPLVICGSTGWISVNVIQGVTESVNTRMRHRYSICEVL